MGVVSAAAVVPLSPEQAVSMWRDPRRWSSFVEGFQRVEEQGADWPEAGSRIIWLSGRGGRGRVTEKVAESRPDGFGTRVFEDRLRGLQSFRAVEDARGARVELSLEYELTSGGPLRAVTDMLFIRRALREALERTLRRYAVEAEDEAGLR
jgi:hypothetical protein